MNEGEAHRALFNQLMQAGAVKLAQEVFPNEAMASPDRQIAKVSVDPTLFETHIGAIADAFIAEAEELISQGEVKRGFGRLVSGLQSLVQSITQRGVGLDALIDRIDKYRNVALKACATLKGKGVSIEVSFGVTFALNIAIHF